MFPVHKFNYNFLTYVGYIAFYGLSVTSLYVRFTYVDINVIAGFDNCFFKLIVVYSVGDTEKFNTIMAIVKKLFISPPTTTLSFNLLVP